MFERFTEEARGVVLHARQEAKRLRHQHVGTEHILLALLSVDAGRAYTVLYDAGLDAPRVRADIERLLGPSRVLGAEDAAALRTIGIDLDAVLARIEESFGPEALERPGSSRGRVAGTGFTRRAKKVLELSLREAIRLRHRRIGSEHILLGLIREGNGLAAKVIFDAGIDLDELRRAALTDLDEAA